MNRIVVVGASAAGLTAAESLRRRGYDGRLTLVGSERHLPYDRPPLSKQILAGRWQPQRAVLRSQEELARLDADLRLGRTAISLDPESRQIRLDDGEKVTFDRLIVATGVVPRRLPDSDLAGVHVLRSLDDAVALRTELLAGPRLVVVGAGFLGTETAAAARSLGLEVTLVEPARAPCMRPFGERIGTLIAALHRDHGVRVRSGTPVRRLCRAGDRVTGVELADGTVLQADVVVQAIGSRPATRWLRNSGLTLGDGVECDEHCRAATAVYAAGDVASWHNRHFGTRMRLEHRMNATEQAMSVAGNLLGDPAPFAPIPFFWTDQYDSKIQAYGVFPAGAEMRVLGGDTGSGRFTAGYGRDGRVVGVLGWNAPREVRRLRRLVAERAAWEDVTAGATVQEASVG